MKCSKGYEVKPLRSAAGWYIGTTDDCGAPNCRLTSLYAVNEEGVKALRIDREDTMENIYCNKCGKCNIK